jgi:hypothetical protein
MLIVTFVLGVVVGALGMYLIARNSPNHFLKFKKFADEVDRRVKQSLNSIVGR